MSDVKLEARPDLNMVEPFALPEREIKHLIEFISRYMESVQKISDETIAQAYEVLAGEMHSMYGRTGKLIWPMVQRHPYKPRILDIRFYRERTNEENGGTLSGLDPIEVRLVAEEPPIIPLKVEL